MPSRKSASPSPPPSAPTQTIVQPGPRASALQKIYASALTSTLKSNSYENFSSCFPTPAKYCPTALEGVWRQLNGRLEEECAKDFNNILEERNVIAGLNEWDEILEQARQRRDRAVETDEHEKGMHLWSAEELHRAFLSGYLVKAAAEMEGKLKETQDENQNLMNHVQTQRDEIHMLMTGLEGMARDVDGAVKALEAQLEENGHVQLRKEVWTIESEMSSADQDPTT